MSYTIGILGGLGPEGTVHYYRKLTNQLASIPLEHGRPGIVIEHVWIDRFSGLLRSGSDDEVGALLPASLERLRSSTWPCRCSVGCSTGVPAAPRLRLVPRRHRRLRGRER